MDKLFKWVQEMYPNKTDEEIMQQLEQLVKQDVLKHEVKNSSWKSKTHHIEDIVITTEFDVEYLPTCQQPKFKVGDKVRVTEKVAEYAKEDEDGWSDIMLSSIGKEFELHTFRYNTWILSGEVYFPCPEDCLELVTSKEEDER